MATSAKQLHPPGGDVATDPLASLLEQIKTRHEQLAPAIKGEVVRTALPSPGPGLAELAPKPAPPIGVTCAVRSEPPPPAGSLIATLEAFGLVPLHAARLAQAVNKLRAQDPSFARADDMALVTSILSVNWRQPPRPPASRPWHIFIGAPGAGKTTCLGKWLTQSVLLAGCAARVWRLDGATANTAEALGVYAEVLSVPLERAWPATQERSDSEVHFVDLPGVDWTDPAAVAELGRRLKTFRTAQVHLVLNAAYEAQSLLQQVEAFAGLPITDLIVTHLEEEPRWGKLWNFVLGTKLAIGFLSAGQNVPGFFRAASVEQLLPRQTAPMPDSSAVCPVR